MTVGELFDRMPASEFAEWQVFELLDGPLGGRRGDAQAAAISYWALLPHLGEDARDISMYDLMLRFGEKPEKKD